MVGGTALQSSVAGQCSGPRQRGRGRRPLDPACPIETRWLPSPLLIASLLCSHFVKSAVAFPLASQAYSGWVS
jgi:hypothetical protein